MSRTSATVTYFQYLHNSAARQDEFSVKLGTLIAASLSRGACNCLPD